jgi:hypothetical protein
VEERERTRGRGREMEGVWTLVLIKSLRNNSVLIGGQNLISTTNPST